VNSPPPDWSGLDWASFDWAAFDEALTPPPTVEGLRERKKRLTRQHLSGTATAMFLDRGFDAVRVSEIAEACQVSEKTVYNYFPTKESLLLDREEAMAAALRAALAEPGRSPVQAMVALLGREVDALNTQGDHGPAIIRRFQELIDDTPALRAHQHDTMDRLVDVAAEALAHRAGLTPDDPEARMAAHAILGLWDVLFHGLRDADGTHTAAQLRRHVIAHVTRAARVLDTGLSLFDPSSNSNPSSRRPCSGGDPAEHEARQVTPRPRPPRPGPRR